MKKLLIPALAIIVMTGCQKDDNSIPLSTQDKVAIEGMDTYLEKAISYNDSLQMVCDTVITGNDSLHQHYDDMLHYCDSMYQSYNNEFSHDDDHGDHSHNNQGMMGHMDHMGDMHESNDMMHDHNSHDNHGDDLNHQMADHLMMGQIMESHCHDN